MSPRLPRAAKIVWLLVCLGLTDGSLNPALAQGAKAKKGAAEKPELEGKVTRVAVKGKTVQLTVELEGKDEPVELLLTPKMKVAITAPGDAALFQPRVVVGSSTVFESNKELFTRKFDVYLGSSPPKPGIQPVPNAGETYQVIGAVASVDDQSVTLNVQGAPRRLRFENGETPEVWVHATDIELIRPESSIRILGTLRGDKIVASQVAVTMANPFTPDELLGKKEKKPRAPAKTAAKSKQGAKGDDEEAGDAEEMDSAEDADPFGVLGKKKKQAEGGKKEAAPPSE